MHASAVAQRLISNQELQILTERPLGRRAGSGRDRSTSGLRVEAKKGRMQLPIWTKHAAVEISMCRGCEKHTYRSSRCWGQSADGLDHSLAGTAYRPHVRPTTIELSGPETECHTKRSGFITKKVCDLHALPPMSALRHDLRSCR